MTLPKIYITIDDGLDPTHSIEILSLLKKYEAKATFFWITQKAQELHDNNIALFSEILSLINTDGHEIGFHDPADYLPNLKSRIWSHFSFAEFTKGLEDLSKLTGKNIQFYRPHCLLQPLNYFYAKKLGLKYILSSPNGYINPEAFNYSDKIHELVQENTVLVLHENYTLVRSSSNGESLLPLVLDKAKEKGLVTETLSNR